MNAIDSLFLPIHYLIYVLNNIIMMHEFLTVSLFQHVLTVTSSWGLLACTLVLHEIILMGQETTASLPWVEASQF